MCSNNPKKPEEPFSGYSLCPWALAGWHRLEGPSELRQLLSGQRPGVTFCSSWPGAWNFRVTLGPTALMVHQHTHTQLQDPPWEDATKQTSGLLKEFSIPPQQHGALLPRPTGIGQQAQVHAVRTQFQSLAVLRLQRDHSLVPKQQLDSAHARRHLISATGSPFSIQPTTNAKCSSRIVPGPNVQTPGPVIMPKQLAWHP